MTGGRGADVIVDGIGGDITQRGFLACAPGGRYCMFGNVDRASFTFKYDLNPMRGNRSVIGVSLASEAGKDRVRAIVERHLRAIASGELRAVVDRTFALAQAADAHAYIEARRSFGRVLLIP